MQCPLCNVPLHMTVRKDVEIDYCPQCRGVWLDRGELDKIIERSNADLESAPQPVPQRQQQDDFGRGQQYNRGAYPPAQHDQHHYSPQKKRKSFLSDLLDFD